MERGGGGGGGGVMTAKENTMMTPCHENVFRIIAIFKGIHLPPAAFTSQRASNAELDVSFGVSLHKLLQQTGQWLVIWDATTLIWRHCHTQNKRVSKQSILASLHATETVVSNIHQILANMRMISMA